jgi:hypothetical protein
MADWTDTLADAVFQIAQSFMDSNRPKRLVGIAFIAITAFGMIGTFAAVAFGAENNVIEELWVGAHELLQVI